MFVWRNAIILGAGFAIVGLLYLSLQGSGSSLDLAGATMLVVLGAAMMFTFAILLRGSRGL
jgi:inner membrane protein involved in colicin E2 resistance